MGDRIYIHISGRSGIGKTLIADALEDLLGNAFLRCIDPDAKVPTELLVFGPDQVQANLIGGLG